MKLLSDEGRKFLKSEALNTTENAALIESENPSAEGETMHKGNFPFVHSNTSKVDLNLTLTQNGDRISGGIEYNTDLFNPETIDDMIAHYKKIAEQAIRDLEIHLIDIPLDTESHEPDADARGSEQRPAGGNAGLIDTGKFSFE